MNANELADYLQNKAEVELNPRLQESATMLRQQQAEIEALKEQIKENDVCLKILMQRLDDGTNEHYCLVWEDAYGKLKVVDKYPPPEGSIKLYTHPANPYQSITDTKIEPTIVSYTHPVKEHFEDEPQAEELHEILQSNLELTDEEWIITYQTWALTGNDPLALKRAILRKAQEK